MTKRFIGAIKGGWRLRAAALAAIVFWSPARAASLQVSPVSLSLTAKQNADGLWLFNSGNAPLQAQVRVFRWTQAKGGDVLAPTTELVASPPMITVEPGRRQIIRIVRVNSASPPPAVEQTFRLLVDEIPALDAPGVQFALRYSIPVFILGAAKASAAALDWKIEHRGKDVVLHVVNTGGGYAKITNVGFTPTNGKKLVLSKGLYGYVLAKNSRDWQLEHHGRAFLGGGVLSAKVNTREVTVSLPPVSDGG